MISLSTFRVIVDDDGVHGEGFVGQLLSDLPHLIGRIGTVSDSS